MNEYPQETDVPKRGGQTKESARTQLSQGRIIDLPFG